MRHYEIINCCNEKCPSSQNNVCVLGHPKCVDRIETENKTITRDDGLTEQEGKVMDSFKLHIKILT